MSNPNNYPPPNAVLLRFTPALLRPIISPPCKWTKHVMLAEVCSDDALVRLHTIAKYGRRDYRPKLKHVISPNTSCFTYTPFSHQVRFEVVKIAVCESEKPFRNSPWS